jgi:hypothetical protein
MKPTAYILFVIGLALAVSAALLPRTSNPSAPVGADPPGSPNGPPALIIALLVAAASAVAVGWVLLRYGGKGYTVTTSAPRR